MPKKSKKIEAPSGSPERVVRFFEEELADYEGRAAHGDHQRDQEKDQYDKG